MTNRLDPEHNRPTTLPTTASHIHCQRCGRNFAIGAMRWDHRRGLWVCAHWPECEGAGFHCDLHDGPVAASVDSRLENEALVALTDASKLLPTRNGKRVHYSTVYRWAMKGARGRVLETILVGGIRYTSREALVRFQSPGRPPASDAKNDALREHLYGTPRRAS